MERVIDVFEVIDGSGASGSVRVRYDGREIPVPGSVLEAQFELPGPRFLLLLTDDSPYEEALHAVLLDDDGRQLEHRWIGEPYAPGLLRDLRVEAPGRLSFRFLPGVQHRLEIRDEPRGRLRPRWMRVHSRPDPE